MKQKRFLMHYLNNIICENIQYKQLFIWTHQDQTVLTPCRFWLESFYDNRLQMTLENIIKFGRLVRPTLPSY